MRPGELAAAIPGTMVELIRTLALQFHTVGGCDQKEARHGRAI